MNHATHVGFGSIRHLRQVLSRFDAKRVLLVTGRKGFSVSGAEAALKSALLQCEVQRFCECSENPKADDLRAGLGRFHLAAPDVVIAVGGGSAIDMAKLMNGYATHGLDHAVTRGRPLIAIPTTAGTGAEATAYATLYIDARKHSIGNGSLLPDVAIVDPVLTRSLPPRVTALTGMDALTQAIESFWCVNSTDESKHYAACAIRLILPNLKNAVHNPGDEARLAMARGSHLAGKAIAITRTTAAHAVSYPLTARFGVPHGQAVCLTLADFLVFNYGVGAGDVADSRGVAYVKETLDQVCELLGCKTVQQASAALRSGLRQIGLAASFAELGIDKARAIETVIEELDVERLVNNPRRVTRDHLRALLGAIE